MHALNPSKAHAYLELTKPRITWMILISTAAGYYFGHSGPWSAWQLGNTLAGTGLVASGAAALNQWYEREADQHMKRTRMRPLPTRRLTPAEALSFGIALSCAGLAQLALAVNSMAAALCFATLVLYLFLYTPLKQRTWWSTTIGAIPGAMPPLIGFAGASGKLTAEGLTMAAILFLWQFPHFYAIAWMYRDDYARAGMQMLPVVDPDGVSTSRQMVWYSLALIPVSLLPQYLGMTGTIYTVGALALGLWFLRSAVRVSRNRTSAYARQVLLASVVYLPILYALMMLDPASL